MKPVCLIVGAGAGIGGHVGKRFAEEGYHTCLCRRSNATGLDKIVNEIKESGGEAEGFILDATHSETIENLVEQIEKEIGPVDVAVYNLGAQIGDRSLADISYKQFELGWRLGTFGLFRLASSLFPKMVERGKGAVLVTSSTAAVRGNEGQHSHAAAMGGRRMLCQTLNAEFSPKGIHIAHVIIDGAVDAPDTLGKMLGPQQFQKLRETRGLEKDGLLLPEEIADTYFHIANQHRSAWTHEVDLRSFSDKPWWNR
ncbi:MAG: SDR family NAD(P)-dependent oxidoreductase [Pseudomonadota bacterium]|nr:SDR family NAD(P)-dependent oxidoreductase [Pseudomonadota bacterium]